MSYSPAVVSAFGTDGSMVWNVSVATFGFNMWYMQLAVCPHPDGHSFIMVGTTDKPLFPAHSQHSQMPEGSSFITVIVL